MAISYSKNDPIQHGVLVCIDEKKELFKYIRLNDVKIGEETLEQVLKRKDDAIEGLAKEIEKINKTLGINTELVLDLASEKGDDF